MPFSRLFRQQGKGLVGIDIGSTQVKVVELSPGSGDRYSLAALGREPLPPETVVDGAIIAKVPLAERIETVFQRKKISSKQIATSISGHSIIVKKVSLPFMTDEELAESIRWEAEQYIPFDLTEVNVDYQILSRLPEEQKIEIILVAAKKEKIADYTSAVAMAGRTPVVVDIDAFALLNAYEVNYRPEPDMVAAILNIGASSINVSIIRGTEFLFTRDITSGGNQYTDFVQREFDIDFSLAERYKLGIDRPADASSRIAGVLRTVSENIALEIEKTFDYFKTTTYSHEIQKLYICGGASKTEGLMEYLAESFHFPIERLDPFRRIETGGRLESEGDAQLAAADYAVAVGLALRTA